MWKGQVPSILLSPICTWDVFHAALGLGPGQVAPDSFAGHPSVRCSALPLLSHLLLEALSLFGWDLGFCDDTRFPAPGLTSSAPFSPSSKPSFWTFKKYFSL